jgi:hypothetical protein
MAISDYEIRNADPRKAVSFDLAFTRGLNRARMSRGTVNEPVRLAPGERYRFRERLGIPPNRAKEVCESSPQLLSLAARGAVEYGPWPRRERAKGSTPAPTPPPKRPKLAGEPAAMHREALESGSNPAPLPSPGHGTNASAALDPAFVVDDVELPDDLVEMAPLDEAEEGKAADDAERDPFEKPNATWKLHEIVSWAEENGLDLSSADKRTKQKALRAIAREEA